MCRTKFSLTFTCGVCVQVLAYSVACVSVSAFSAGLIDAAKAEEVMDTLRSLTEESQQVSRYLMEVILAPAALCGFIDDPVSPDPGLLPGSGVSGPRAVGVRPRQSRAHPPSPARSLDQNLTG